jgi:hypothetical protein
VKILQSLWELGLYSLFQVGGQLHLEGLSASDQGEGTRKVLNDEICCIQNFVKVRVESEIFKDQLSSGDECDGD